MASVQGIITTLQPTNEFNDSEELVDGVTSIINFPLVDDVSNINTESRLFLY